ncbi:MAG: SCO family protein [Anaerolineae bacterium]|nr:SCO family protein [Anaerolineales bacterium]MCQ3976409.1 SCO family protein [Anaerolineae bacterium]
MLPITKAMVYSKSQSMPRLVVGGLLALVVLAGLVVLLGTMFKPYTFRGMVLQSPQPATNFTLTSHMGQPISLTDFKGQLVLLYFGYTTCPDVCPTTLAELKQARQALGQRSDEVQVLMVTVDPERDTVPVLADYMTHFDPSFIGLTGTSEEIAQVATYYGIFYERKESESALGYLVDHTATVMAIDRDGYLRVVYPYGAPSEDIASDLDYMLKR